MGVLVYRAPWMSSDFASDIRDVAKEHQGTRIEGAAKISSRAALFASALVGRLWSHEKRVEYHRILAGVRNRGRADVAWEVSVYGTRRVETGYPAEAVSMGNASERTGDFRFRGKIGVDSGGALQCRARIDYLAPVAGKPGGTILLLGIGFKSARFDARVQAVGHSLPPGRAAYITRPGIGSFELFSGLYGTGSDLAVRLRCVLGYGVSAVLFNGSSTAGTRAYLGIECRR
jgi:hypothetical protein